MNTTIEDCTILVNSTTLAEASAHELGVTVALDSTTRSGVGVTANDGRELGYMRMTRMTRRIYLPLEGIRIVVSSTSFDGSPETTSVAATALDPSRQAWADDVARIVHALDGDGWVVVVGRPG